MKHLQSAGVGLTLREAARMHGGNEDPDRDEMYLFNDPSDAASAARELGSKVSLPSDRSIAFRATRKGKVVAEFERRDGDSFPAATPSRKNWTLPLGILADRRSALERVAPVDPLGRLIVEDGPNGRQVAGRVIRDHADEWVWIHSSGDARNHLLAKGFDRREVDAILGLMVECPWRRVHIPFGPEYPGDRQWNLGAPQFVYKPRAEPGPTPHWDTVLSHCFADLNEALKSDEWAQRSGIDAGHKYGLAWVASLFRHPFDRLPYLFFYGPQNSGKSIFHEALALLMTKGVAAADRALTNSNDFNGELANAVLAYVEEKNVATAPGAYAKLKDWVTSPVLTIRRMRTDAYRQPNTLHFVQCANELTACPADFDDTRRTMIHVPPLETEIPKPLLISRLKEEAPHFMRTILDLPLPKPLGRLRLPAIQTAGKEAAALASVPELAQAVAAAMASRDRWEGVSKELPDLLGEGDWPSDARRVKRELADAAPFLRHHGIATNWQATNAGQRLTLTRKAV
ncbi:MAG TPA: primase-helicase family protein [Pirellulaceae bacterium]|jgi:hypothetical protein|nr:primase-helicase family protein [Pirellulaceae bacterium]